jgi:hypothetical protein
MLSKYEKIKEKIEKRRKNVVYGKELRRLSGIWEIK